ncbi:hypothetical protein Slin15195_G094830 [Septoria linicola]|uniref:Uncharacterized protein n=1 Tax=Septoria linicola TaxID=215465 RepID=A0A9Q9AVF6_9PEZI|nr:hypothetical protein Slin15195_G094830 [Septoria linicola]
MDSAQTHDHELHHDSRSARNAMPAALLTDSSLTRAPTRSVSAPPHRREMSILLSLINFEVPPATAATQQNSGTDVSEEYQAALEDIERIVARVEILNAKFDKVEKLEMDLGIYEIIAENGDREFRERVEAIKRMGTVADGCAQRH